MGTSMRLRKSRFLSCGRCAAGSVKGKERGGWSRATTTLRPKYRNAVTKSHRYSVKLCLLCTKSQEPARDTNPAATDFVQLR